MKKYIVILCAISALVSCKKEQQLPENTIWELEKTIALDGINPIGIALDGNLIYLSDGDNNRVVAVDSTGKTLFIHEGFERPMHIDFGSTTAITSGDVTKSARISSALFVPEYGRDSIAILRKDARDYLALKDSLDAPAAISVFENEIAIADFYNHRILYYNGSSWMTIGAEGKEPGMFYYPTDVQITKDRIFVADAYNNRGQAFDKSGKLIAVFGEDQKMNAATGIYVSDDEIYLTDFERKRVLVFSKDYGFKQALTTQISKPTDVIVFNGKLLITDYSSGMLVQYKPIAVPVPALNKNK